MSTSTPAENAIGKGVFDVYKPYDEKSSGQFAQLRQALDFAAASQTPVKLPVIHFEIPGISNTTISSWQIELTPVAGSNGQTEHLLCTVVNVTEQESLKKSESDTRDRESKLIGELKSMNEQLTATNEELSATIDDLIESRDNYQRLTNELESRVESRTSALSASEKKLKVLLDSLPSIAWTSKLTGEVDFYNRYWYDYTGLTFEESRSWGWKQVIHPDDLQYNIDTLTKILESGLPGEFEIREQGTDGIYRWFLVRLQPSFDSKGNIDGWVGIATDIDSIKKLEQQKDEFISIASHELKTPLTTLKAALQMLDKLKQNPLSEMLPKVIDQANRNVHKVTSLVDTLLNIHRIQEGKLVLQATSFRLSELVNACCNYLSITSRQKINIQGDKDVMVFADELSVDQVITNIVTNAIKYAPKSHEILISVERQEPFAKVSIKDSGPGIPREKLPFIFQRYYQHGVTDFRNPGLGLGLFISSEIIKRNGGQIGVESEVGQGSTFWFTVPLANE